MQKKTVLLLALLTLLGGILRFYQLDWSAPYFLHPDERNIASAVSRLTFPDQLNPKFFAYGSFPIYLTYILGVGVNLLSGAELSELWRVDFGLALLIGRAISALLATLMIPLVYVLVRTLTVGDKNRVLKNPPKPGSKRAESWESPGALLAMALTAFTPGLIQYAHFSTFEIIQAFELLLVTYFGLKILQEPSWRNYLLTGVVVGLSVSTKITSLVALAPFLLAHFFVSLKRYHDIYHDSNSAIIVYIARIMRTLINQKLIATALVSATTFFASSPYVALDYEGFRGSMKYETAVATGQLPVFYTGHFIDTWPVIHQLRHVFPYVLGWPLTVLGVGGFGYLGYLGVTKDRRYWVFLSLPLVYLAFHLGLYVKWIRYMVPMAPFLIIASALVLGQLRKLQLLMRWPAAIIVSALVAIQAFYGLAFMNIYRQSDTRIAAADWTHKNIPLGAPVLSEIYDLGIIPFNDALSSQQITLFNFYDLDQPGRSDLTGQLKKLIKESDYIILPSQRIATTRLRLPERFPQASRFYQDLFDGSLGFEKVAEFETSPQFLGIEWNDTGAEETFRVFDHPHVMIFRRRNEAP